MDNVVKAFEKCLASIVTEQVSLPSNTVRMLYVLHPSPSLCVHHLPLALARSIPSAIFSRVHRRMAAADARRL
eukprot:300093-Prymnesium_polylepis.1